jgi:hypothetical protein
MALGIRNKILVGIMTLSTITHRHYDPQAAMTLGKMILGITIICIMTLGK